MQVFLYDVLIRQRWLMMIGVPLAFGALTFGLGPKLAYCAVLGL